MGKKPALGRGLDSLIPGAARPSARKEIAVELRISDIKPNNNQPRKSMKPQELDELIQSVKTEGVLQPILVKEIKDGEYEIIAGERRFTAAQRAGLKTVPAIIRKNISSVEQNKLALIENIQRQDLNPVEEALAYKGLIEGYGCTQEELSDKLKKNRNTIANMLRILKLPEAVRNMVADGAILTGHAKVLLGIEDENKLKAMAALCAKEGLSVRDLEKLLAKASSKKKGQLKKGGDAEMAAIEQKLSHFFGTKVRIKGAYKKGKVEVEYYSKDDFERILEKLRIH